jgi:two-component system sensor histidine kinase PilS (NtrC family)
MKFNEKFFSNEINLTQKIQTLIIGRLLVIFLLLVASWFYNSSGNLKLSFENFPQGLFLVFLISVGLTIVYFFVLRLNQNFTWQVRIQFLLDTLLITWLVWRTGDLASPFIMLYIVSISIASVFLSGRETILMASFSALLFTVLSVSVALSLYRYGTAPDLSKTIQIIGFNDVAIFVVGLLAARLSERHASGEKLKETAKTLANLRVLHERIVESIRSGLITTDLEGNIYTFNATAVEITGYTADEMRGKSVYTLFGDIKLPIKDALEATETGDQPPRFETDVITPEGFALRVGYGVSPLYAEDGDTTGLIVTFQDLTEIRSIEETGRRKDRLAAVGRVAAGLAHEIRNPLGAMRGAIQVLQSQTPPESAQADLMEIILRESDRLNKIITNFLTYARPRVSNFSEIDVREAIEDSFTLLRHSPDVGENHVLEAVLPEDPVIISADPTQLKQIFWNLARNAIQAMNDVGTLKVSLEKVANDRIRILFEDTGSGMPPEQVEQLFEPFSKSTTGGTGLGLSIVYQIIRDHSGSINVRSRENEGTTITIELPIEFRPTGASSELGSAEPAAEPSRLEDFLTVKK